MNVEIAQFDADTGVLRIYSREPIDPSEWGPPYNFGAIGGMPPGWTVRYHRPNEMFFILPDDDPERADGVFCSPWIARRYARGYVRNTDSRSEGL